MANEQNLRKWKKGQSGNPLGGKIQNVEKRAIRNLTEQEMIEIGSLVVKGSLAELKEIAKDPNASALKCMMAAVAVKTISKGDPYALDTLLNRLVGKPKERIEMTGQDGGPQVIVHLPAKDQKEIIDITPEPALLPETK